MSGITDRLIGVSSVHMPVRHQIAVAVYFGCVFLHGLPWITHHFQFFVFHFHKSFGLFQDLRRLSGHKGDGVAQIMGDLSHRDHTVPVLFQMSHLHVSRDIFCGKHRDYSGKRFGFLCVYSFYKGSRIPGADSASVDHTLHFHIVRIFAVSQHFFPYIHSGNPLSQLPLILFFRRKPFPFIFCRQKDPVNNLLIAGTPADVVLYGIGRLRPGGIRILVYQAFGADHHARNTEAALHGSRFSEGPDKDLLFLLRKSFNGQDLFPFQL